jgi:anthranilate synthase component 2
VDVFRNDEITLDEIGKYNKILLSPGPGIPQEAGIMLDLIKQFAPTHSIFGVCLGEQAIGEAFGATLINLPKVFHGVATTIQIENQLELSKLKNDWFNEMDSSIEVGRYHSWVVSEKDFPNDLEITSRDASGMIMSLRHKIYDVQGVQFHPESVLTPHGKKMIENWLKP